VRVLHLCADAVVHDYALVLHFYRIHSAGALSLGRSVRNHPTGARVASLSRLEGYRGANKVIMKRK
jgi:hypothetical protein